MFGDEPRVFSEEEKKDILSGKMRWGRWRYIAESGKGEDYIGILSDQTKEFYQRITNRDSYSEEDCLYDISLSDINTEAKVGMWVLHLAGKDWVLKEDIGDLIDMLLDLYYFGILVISADKKDPGRCKALWCYNRTGSLYCIEHQKRIENPSD